MSSVTLLRGAYLKQIDGRMLAWSSLPLLTREVLLGALAYRQAVALVVVFELCEIIYDCCFLALGMLSI